jgi:intracellular septation protein A
MLALRTTFLRCTTFVSAMLAAGTVWAGGTLFGQTPEIGGSNDIRAAAIAVIKRVLEFMALVAVIFIVVAGIRLIVSQGEEAQKDSAKKTIIYVIIGLVIIVFARAIVEFVADVLLNTN